MAHLELNRAGESFAVSWLTINGRKERRFPNRQAAEQFANSKMGKAGSVISTLDMTPAQLADWRAREQRARDMMAAPAVTP